MLRSLLNGALNTAFLFIIFQSQSKTPWFENKLRDSILFVAVVLATGLISFLTQNLRRQLELSISQKNRITGKETTEYCQSETGQKARTVNMEVKIKRKRGLNFFIRYYLKKRTISILIECNPPGIELQALDADLQPDEITSKSDNSGFYSNITEYIVSVSKFQNEAEPFKRIPYFIKETKESRRYFNANVACYINPVLMVDQKKKAPFWFRFVIGWNPDQHKIEYYHNDKKESSVN